MLLLCFDGMNPILFWKVFTLERAVYLFDIADLSTLSVSRSIWCRSNCKESVAYLMLRLFNLFSQYPSWIQTWWDPTVKKSLSLNSKMYGTFHLEDLWWKRISSAVGTGKMHSVHSQRTWWLRRWWMNTLKFPHKPSSLKHKRIDVREHPT